MPSNLVADGIVDVVDNFTITVSAMSLQPRDDLSRVELLPIQELKRLRKVVLAVLVSIEVRQEVL